MPEPSQEITPPAERFASLDPLGFNGRIGRLRFLVWSTVLTLITVVTGILVLLAVNVSPTLGITCGATLAIAYVFISLRIGAQRLHDLNWSAWMLLLQQPISSTLQPYQAYRPASCVKASRVLVLIWRLSRTKAR